MHSRHASYPNTSERKSFRPSNGISIWYVTFLLLSFVVVVVVAARGGGSSSFFCCPVIATPTLIVRSNQLFCTIIHSFFLTHSSQFLFRFVSFHTHLLKPYCFTSLNVQYGFSKVRRGPDTDMYAHPSFIRGKPELLFNLRKCATATKNRTVAAASNKKNDNTTGPSAARKPRPQLKKRSKVARPSPALPTRRAPSLAASASASSSTPTSSSTCYESDDHSTGGTVISHEEDHATYHHLAERAGLNPSVAAAAATANQVYLKKKTKATPATARSTFSSPERRSWGGTQSALVSPSKYIPSQKPLLLMPKTGSTTPSSSSSTPPPSRPVMGGLDMLAMAVEFA
mmetsp:Transcript_25639/g.60680  ORF Transcript_25639/g.60680 Transcript_25639/m.60680 type:complete len:342 (+) Transcript_25639:606-1631(+)